MIVKIHDIKTCEMHLKEYLEENVWLYIRILEETKGLKINGLKVHLNKLEEQREPKLSLRKEIIQVRAEINEIGKKETAREKINKPKGRFFERINKIDEILVRLIRNRERERRNANYSRHG